MQATPDRSLLITADAGPKASLLVFWDPATGQPITTVQNPHDGGVMNMAVSADGRQLATVSASTQDSEGSQQEVCAMLMCHCTRL
jgi:WD40 repeat protein